MVALHASPPPVPPGSGPLASSSFAKRGALTEGWRPGCKQGPVKCKYQQDPQQTQPPSDIPAGGAYRKSPPMSRDECKLLPPGSSSSAETLTDPSVIQPLKKTSAKTKIYFLQSCVFQTQIRWFQCSFLKCQVT